MTAFKENLSRIGERAKLFKKVNGRLVPDDFEIVMK